jgi:crossover junction endonuclease EME1
MLAEKAERQQIEALNRLKSRKEACPELITYLSPTLPDTLHDEVINFIEPLGIDTREWTTSTMDVIKFVRKVSSEWDEEGSMFRPCDEYKKDEEWIIHWMKADKFIDLVCNDQTGLALRFHLEKLKNVIHGNKILIILEGLGAFLAKARTARNRAHDTAVRNQRGEESRYRKDDQQFQYVSEEIVENALIEMQLVHEIRIVQTAAIPESAEWISILATDIASIPYRYIFCYC